MNNSTKSKISRRNFLLTAGAGGAAAAAALAARAFAPAESKAAAVDDKRRGKGYQESAHVRSYYNTTKV
jgi:TAT (twin-arginine translocation) pathway signal sequence